MRAITLLAIGLISLSANSQNQFGRELSALSTQLVSPTIALDKTEINAVGSMKGAAIYGNLPITTNYDEFTLGAGYRYSNDRNFSSPEFYVGRTSLDGMLRMSISVALYRVASDGIQLNAQKHPFMDRRASQMGFCFSYHPTEKMYFGVNMNDLYDFAWTDGSDDVFYKWEAMTPRAYANVPVWDNNFESISIFGDISYNPVQKEKYTLSLEFKGETLKAGAFYSNQYAGAFIEVQLNRISLYVSQGKETAIGAKIDLNN